MKRTAARGRYGRARGLGGPFLLIAGGLYFLMAAHGEAAPPDVVTTGTALAYTENAAAAAVDPGLTLTDVDGGDTIDGATVAITANLQSSEDVLAFSSQLGISGGWNAGTGTLTLSGTTTVADYQTVMRLVTYQNTSDNPNTPTTVAPTSDSVPASSTTSTTTPKATTTTHRTTTTLAAHARTEATPPEPERERNGSDGSAGSAGAGMVLTLFAVVAAGVAAGVGGVVLLQRRVG